MKRQLLALVAALGLLVGTAAGAAAQPPDQAAADVSAQCVGGVGVLVVTVHDEPKVARTVPPAGSQGGGPCAPPPGQAR